MLDMTPTSDSILRARHCAKNRRFPARFVMPFLSLLIALAGSGCATPKQQPGIPRWESESAGIGVDNQSLSKALGGMFSGMFGAMSGYYGIRGTPQDDIALSASELNDAILDALTPHPILNAQSATALAPQLHANIALHTDTNQPNSWRIADVNNGQITTDWQSVPGRTTGMWWWQKTYETEVRHIITIRQSLHSPHLTGYTIVTEARERPNHNYPWETADPELGRQSFEQLRDVLLVSIREQLGKRKVKR